MFKNITAGALLTGVAYQASTWNDCNHETDVNDGPFGPINFYNGTTTEGHPVYGWLPTRDSDHQKFPLIGFMHGSTGQWEFYDDILKHYSSHGFVVVFPFVKSPEKDKNPFTTNTDGSILVQGIEWAKAANKDSSSPLFGMIDEDNLVIAGHSMGATDSIMASKTLDPAKLTVT